MTDAGAGPRKQRTLTAVPGIRVGHHTAPSGKTGCTVVLGPFRGAVHVTGTATGSRELHTLSPEHVVPRVDAVLLTGGSAFGLAAADGVVAWLEERGCGYETRVAPVPIVPAAVVYDLREDEPRPGSPAGWAACEAASEEPVERGRVGAGAGTTVGKIAGLEGAMPGGVGGHALGFGPWTVGALAVVNAVGDVLDGEGRIVAGARGADGRFLDGAALAASDPHAHEDVLGRDGGEAPGGRLPDGPEPGANTVLSVVATDAPLDRTDLARVARMASAAVARRISPPTTPYDGDVVFALSTAEARRVFEPRTVLGLGTVALSALEASLTDAVR